MRFEKPQKKHIPAAVELAKRELQMEQQQCLSLETKDYTDTLTSRIGCIFEEKHGLVAIEDNQLVGYLAFWSGFENHFGYAKGAFSPLFASAFSGNDRGKTASLLFQELSQIMIQDKITSFAICKYAHDEAIAKSFILNGFGIRCSDGIKDIRRAIPTIVDTKYQYSELVKNEFKNVVVLKNALEEHMKNSPTYFPNPLFTEESFIARCESRSSRLFVAKDGQKIIGFIEIENNGEAFITENANTQNICGLYLDSNYRNGMIAENLLNFVINILQKEGFEYLSVDFETINPTALHFWGKYFDSYTYSYIRRIDERILL